MIVRSGSSRGLREKANQALVQIHEWMDRNNLTLAAQKTTAVIFKGPRDRTGVTFNVGNMVITPTKSVKYLGKYIDDKLIYNEHTNKAIEKAEKSYAALARLMPNISGPSQTKRIILSHVVHSILLYGAPIWHRATDIKTYCKKLQGIQRKIMIKISNAYRTISREAANVIGGIIPINLMVKERVRIHLRKKTGEEITDNTRREERENSITMWQEEWDNTEQVAQWTKILIPRLQPWINCEHRRTDYYLTQFLSGHCSFRSYTHRIGKASDPNCIYCGELDTPEHTIFSCIRWRNERDQIRGLNLTSQNIVNKMIGNKENWNTITRDIRNIMKRKEEEMGGV